jgi:glycosyltransferase involved in cell wall biosynthesis
MACGTPVVASYATSIPEVAGDAAMLVDPNDLDAISSAVELLLNDEDRLKQMKHKGLARSGLFRWDRAARQVLDLLKREPHVSQQSRFKREGFKCV